MYICTWVWGRLRKRVRWRCARESALGKRLKRALLPESSSRVLFQSRVRWTSTARSRPFDAAPTFNKPLARPL